jgi:hypothetical protein
MKNYYFLFGYDACMIFHEHHDTIQDKANDIMKESYGVYQYDELEDSPLQLLNAFIGWNDYAPINEELYNLLNQII